MKIFILCCLSIVSGMAMAEGIFIQSYNEVSKRYAFLDEFNNTGVLFLSEMNSKKPDKDAFAYMQEAPLDKEVWKAEMKVGKPPKLHKGIASKTSVILETNEGDFSFQWSENGNAVALLYKREPIAFVSLSEQYGFSKAVTHETPIVNPWDQKLYEHLFSN